MDDIRKKKLPPALRPFLLSPRESLSVEKTAPPVRPASPKKRRPILRSTLVVLGLALLLFLFTLVVFLFKGFSTSERMRFENISPRSFTTELKHLTRSFFSEAKEPLRGEAEGRINILLLGRAGQSYPGKNLTDTVMMLSILPQSKQVALLSLPRDLYVPIGTTDLYTKLNSVYQYGLSQETGATPLKQTIERITGTPIHYFVTVDFDGFEKSVDTLGGISLEVPRDFIDTRYPGKNYSYETFAIKKGWQTLDGATALKYVRERHADPEGDFGRAKRQQQVLQAVKNKAFSLGTLFNIVTVDRLLDTLGDSVKTDMTLDDMARFLELARTLDTKNITTVVIDAWKKESLLRVSHVQVGNVAAFILVPRVGNWNEIIDTSATLFHRDAQAKRKQAIETERPSLTLYVKPETRPIGETLADSLKEELGFASVTLVSLSPLDKQPEESMMTEQVGLTKPYSFDELLKRFSPKRVPSLPLSSSKGASDDFSIIVGTNLIEAFALKEAPADTTLEDPSFSEPLPPQPKRSH